MVGEWEESGRRVGGEWDGREGKRVGDQTSQRRNQ